MLNTPGTIKLMHCSPPILEVGTQVTLALPHPKYYDGFRVGIVGIVTFSADLLLRIFWVRKEL